MYVSTLGLRSLTSFFLNNFFFDERFVFFPHKKGAIIHLLIFFFTFLDRDNLNSFAGRSKCLLYKNASYKVIT